MRQEAGRALHFRRLFRHAYSSSLVLTEEEAVLLYHTLSDSTLAEAVSIYLSFCLLDLSLL